MTADNGRWWPLISGDGPLRARSFAGVGTGPVAHRLAPYRLDQEAAGEMDTEDVDVLIVTPYNPQPTTKPPTAA